MCLYKIYDKHIFKIITQLMVRNVISVEDGENFNSLNTSVLLTLIQRASIARNKRIVMHLVT